MPDSLGELLDQLEGVVDGAREADALHMLIGPMGDGVECSCGAVYESMRDLSIHAGIKVAFARDKYREAVNLLTPLVEVARAAEKLSDVDTLAQDDGEEFCAMCLYPIDQPDVEFCETCALRARLATLSSALSLALEEKKA